MKQIEVQILQQSSLLACLSIEQTKFNRSLL